jgi:hypothetical protein
VAGDGIAVIEVSHPSRVKIDGSSVSPSSRSSDCHCHGFDPAAITVVQVEIFNYCA